MSIILYYYLEHCYKRIVLPEKRKENCIIRFNRVETGFVKDYTLQLCWEGRNWRAIAGEELYFDKAGKKELFMECGTYYSAESVSGERVVLVLGEESKRLWCDKYKINTEKTYKIGKNPECEICYGQTGLVSKYHCEIRNEEGHWIVKDSSVNGVFVQGQRVQKEQVLQYGDEIHIWGLTIVLLGEVLGIYGGLRNLCQVRLEEAGGNEKMAESEFSVDLKKANISLQARKKSFQDAQEEKATVFSEWMQLKREGLLGKNRKWRHYGRLLYSRMTDGLAGFDWIKEDVIGIFREPGKEDWCHVMKVIVSGLVEQNSYETLGMAFLFDEKIWREEDFFFPLRWISYREDGKNACRFFGGNSDEAEEVLYCLKKDMEKENAYKRHYVLFTTKKEWLPNWFYACVKNNTQKRISCVLIGDNFAELEKACGKILYNTGPLAGMYDCSCKKHSRFYMDFPGDEEWMSFVKKHLFMKKLKGKVERNHVTEKREKMPYSLFELYGIDCAKQLGIEKRWKKNRAGDGIKVCIGMGEDGQQLVLNLHEKGLGPHGMLAGTTGSGKSVWMETMMTSLIINYAPRQINFVIVDYKGSGMAKHFLGLPHLAGVLSNFSGKNVQRVIESVNFEINKREKLLETYGLEHVDAYNEIVNKKIMYKGNMYNENAHEENIYQASIHCEEAQDIVLPHLFFVIDEFAEMQKEAPGLAEFFVRVARVGRSLGLHLLVCTQKPKGVVENQIWSNCRYRVCLGVRTREDSEDMIGTKDACYLEQAGSGILWTGDGSVNQKFQTAWGGVLERETEPEIFLMSSTGRRELPNRNFGEKDCTQLQLIVEHIKEKCREMNYLRASLLWCPVLPEKLYVEQLDARGHLCIGLLDCPKLQKQIPWEPEFSQIGHMAVVGVSGSGKRTFLQTLLYQMVQGCTPSAWWCYIFDFEFLISDCFVSSSLVGGVIRTPDSYTCSMYMLKEEMKQRLQLLKGISYEEYPAKGKEFPRILLVISNLSGMRKVCGEECMEDIYIILQQGPMVGIHLLIVGNGIGAKEIPGRMLSYIGGRISFRLQEHYQYEEFFGTTLEEEIQLDCPGRAMILWEGKCQELQVALVHSPDGNIRNRYIEKMVKSRKCEENMEAKKIPQVPKYLGVKEFAEKVSGHSGWEQLGLPYGVHGMSGEIMYWDLNKSNKWLIVGKSGSGKINEIKVILKMQKKRNGNFVVFGSKRRGLEAYVRDMGGSYMMDALEGISVVKKTLEESNKNNSPLVCVLENPEEFLDTVYRYRGAGDLVLWLEQQWKKKRDARLGWIAVLEPESDYLCRKYSVMSALLGEAEGIYMGSGVSEQNYLKFSSVTWQEEEKCCQLGNGLTVSEGKNTIIKLPLSKQDDGLDF